MAIRNLSHIALAASAAALALMPTTASAQAMAGSASSLAWSKSEAILGAPSALQAILSQQHAAPRVAVAPASFSMPMKRLPVLMAATHVVPLPIVGSSMRSPGFE